MGLTIVDHDTDCGTPFYRSKQDTRELEPQDPVRPREGRKGKENVGQNWVVVANSARSTIQNYHFAGSGGESNVVSIIRFRAVRTMRRGINQRGCQERERDTLLRTIWE